MIACYKMLYNENTIRDCCALFYSLKNITECYKMYVNVCKECAFHVQLLRTFNDLKKCYVR